MMNETANLPGDSIHGEKERRALRPSDAPSALRLRLKIVTMGRALCSQISVFSRCTYEGQRKRMEFAFSAYCKWSERRLKNHEINNWPTQTYGLQRSAGGSELLSFVSTLVLHVVAFITVL